MSDSICILLYGRDPRLLQSRQMLLQDAGYEVCMATQFSEVCERLKTGRIELLIVGPTLSREDCDSAVAVADSQMPPVKSLIQRAGHTDGHAEMLHEVIDAMEGPVCLMVAIEKMVSHASFAYSHMY